MLKKIIIYDFDGTLTPYPVPKLAILEKCGLNCGLMNSDFLKDIKIKSENENCDVYLSMYNMIINIMKQSNVEATDNNLSLGSKEIEYNPGVLDFFKNLSNKNTKHYLISSGIKVYLENTNIAKYFSKIYATTFNYQDNKAIGINFLMNDLNKVTAIKEIMKENNCKDCSEIIYIGDGLSDYYAMEYIYKNNGTTILIKHNNNVNKLLDQITSFKADPDYSINSSLYNYIKNK